MKTSLLFFSIAVLFLFSGKSLIAQNNGLSAKLTKTSGNVYTIDNNGKHLISIDISGIDNQKHAENLLKQIRGYRGCEEFNLTQITGTSNWKAEGVFYKYAENEYFKNFLKFIKVTDLTIDNNKVLIDNL